MAQSATRIRRVEFKPKIGAVMRKSASAQKRAFKRLASEIEGTYQRALNRKHYPPASKPGQVPSRRLGNLADDTNVKAEGRTIVVRTYNYGIWLDGGTSKMQARPWIRRFVHDKPEKWEKRFQKLLKEEMKK